MTPNREKCFAPAEVRGLGAINRRLTYQATVSWKINPMAAKWAF
jgi:hypothetical protein